MNKEEILEKSRRENKDERDEIIRDKSMRWTLTTMFCLSTIFAFIRGSKGQSVLDLSVIACGSAFVSFIYRYIKTKKREHLIMGIVFLCAAIMALIRFCMGH